jgi:diaminopimelate epimerase
VSDSGRAFFKMSGSGNDFVVFDARREPPGALETPQAMQELCARGTGVGADGVVFIAPPAAGGDFLMKYFNSDGSRAAMCGNAALCATALGARLGAGSPAGMTIETDRAPLSARIRDGLPEVDLEAVTEVREDAGIPLAPGERRIGFALAGVPHLVVLCDDVTVLDVVGRGRPLRLHPSLSQGANVDFVSRRRDGWSIRTYERGVEGETLACGTGAVATAILLAAWGENKAPEAPLQTRSGRRLTVRLAGGPGSWKPTLRGEGRVVYEGKLPL